MSDERHHQHDLLAEYVDGTLAGNDLAAVESHLAACAECRAEVALASRALIAMEVLPELEAPPGLDPSGAAGGAAEASGRTCVARGRRRRGCCRPPGRGRSSSAGRS